MKLWILGLTAVVLALSPSAVEGSLLFSDNYDVHSNTWDINPNPGNDLPGRQGGVFAPLTYSEVPTLPNYTQLDNGTPTDDELFVVASRRPGEERTPVVSLDQNFKTGHGLYSVDLDMNPANTLNGVDLNSKDWAGVIVGTSSQSASVNKSDGVGFLICDDGEYQIFDGTSGVNVVEAIGDLGRDFGIDESGFYHVSINYRVNAFDDASPVTYSVLVDDTLVHQFTTASGLANNYINFAAHVGYGTPADADRNLHRFDNFQVSVIPEPSSLIVWSLIAITFAGIGWRRRRKAQV